MLVIILERQVKPTFALLSGVLSLAKALKRESGANPEQFPLL
jgi:hypothetical protein